MSPVKISIRFYKDREVRAVWIDESNEWNFSVLDLMAVFNDESDYAKNRNYWKYFKKKLVQENPQLVSPTTQLKLLAADGKRYLTDVVDSAGVVALAKALPNNRASDFLDWFLYSESSLDGQSKKKAYALFETGILEQMDVGTAKGLQKIHAYLFGGLFAFAGKIREKNISKGGFQFANALFLAQTLEKIDALPEYTFDEIVDKYIEMNIAHPFMEGNGRSTRIWLDQILKKRLQQCVDWSRIGKFDYMEAMRLSPVRSEPLKALLRPALTDQINDREMFMKGIDHSYYYEEVD
jgi:cell filamentation protein